MVAKQSSLRMMGPPSSVHFSTLARGSAFWTLPGEIVKGWVSSTYIINTLQMLAKLRAIFLKISRMGTNVCKMMRMFVYNLSEQGKLMHRM